MHSKIIVNSRIEQGLARALEIAALPNPSPDLLIVAADKQASIGIDQIREAISWLVIAPLRAKTKYLLVVAAQMLTEEAQQALLKTLEEPPEKAAVILVSGSVSKILPTILSRCAIENQVSWEKVETTLLQEILGMDLDNRMALSSKYKDKAGALGLVQKLVDQGHELLKSDVRYVAIVTKLLETQKYLEANVHTTMTLDMLWLGMEKEKNS